MNNKFTQTDLENSLTKKQAITQTLNPVLRNTFVQTEKETPEPLKSSLVVAKKVFSLPKTYESDEEDFKNYQTIKQSKIQPGLVYSSLMNKKMENDNRELNKNLGYRSDGLDVNQINKNFVDMDDSDIGDSLFNKHKRFFDSNDKGIYKKIN